MDIADGKSILSVGIDFCMEIPTASQRRHSLEMMGIERATSQNNRAFDRLMNCNKSAVPMRYADQIGYSSTSEMLQYPTVCSNLQAPRRLKVSRPRLLIASSF